MNEGATARRAVVGVLAMTLLTTACGLTSYRDLVVTAEADGAVGVAVPSPPSGGATTSVGSPSDASDDAVATGATPSPTPAVTGSSPSGPVPARGPGSSASTPAGSRPAASGSTSTAPNNQPAPASGGSPAPANGGGPAPSASPSASPGPARPSQAPAPAGLSGDPVKVGFIKLSSFRNLNTSFGFEGPDFGDSDGQVKALVDDINARGGLDGRPVEFVVEEYVTEQASSSNEEQICTAMAQDHKVFAVVLAGQIHESTRACYSAAGVLTLDPSAFTFDDDLYAANSPFYWSPTNPDYSRIMRTLVPALDNQKFFAPLAGRGEVGTSLGVVRWDDPFAERVLETDLKPALAKIGVTVDQEYAVDNTDAGTIQQGLINAILVFRTQGVNRVMFVGGNPLAPFFFLVADNEGYRPRYAVTTLEGPAISSETTPEQMRDAIGIGFNPIHDVLDAQFPFPSTNSEEVRCLGVLADAGHTFTKRGNAELALGYCDSLALLKRASAGFATDLSVTRFAANAERISSAVSATTFDVAYGPGRHDGANAYRLLVADPGCLCFGYASDPVPFR